ncbi:MAG: hypothetical protein JWN23_2917 [Rhodocyclales bacterium]|nr:hypothetical protein [Rhodocyclales bacterium]
MTWHLRGFASVVVGFLSFAIGAAHAASKVEVLVPDSASLIYLTVKNIRHRLDTGSAWNDVSSWFSSGVNKTVVQAIDLDGYADFAMKLRVNGAIVADLNCGNVTCIDNPSGVIFEQALNLPSLSLPDVHSVLVTSDVPGMIYLNNEYTGKTSPATLTLPQGSYKVGLGVSHDNDPTATYSGTYYESSVSLGSKPVTVAFDTSKLSPITGASITKIAILPVKIASSPELDALSRPGVLTQAMVNKFVTQVDATRTKWFKPLSYGLADWKVTVLPMDTTVPLYSQQTSSIVDMAGAYVDTAKYRSLWSSYDVVLVLHSSNDAKGVEISQMQPRWGTAGDGRTMSFSSAVWWASIPSNTPVTAILHEFQHTYETPNRMAKNYIGVDGLHGAEEHGYNNFPGGNYDWLYWYRNFIRGQAGEDSSMRSADTGIPPPYGAPIQPAPYYVGIFKGIHNHLAPQPH